MANDQTEILKLFTKDVVAAAITGKLNARPFLEYAERASAIFGGIDVVLALVETDAINKAFEDDSGESVRILNDYQAGALLSLAREASSIMHVEASSLSSWAADQLANKEAAHGQT